MNSEKQQAAGYLFSAIGEIRDDLINEAIVYTPIRQRKPQVRAFLIAACIVLSMTVILSFGIILSQRSASPNDMTATAATADLDHLLSENRTKFDSAQSESVILLASADDLNFFGGTAHVVWQYADSETLYVSRALTQTEINTLTNEIGKGTPVGENSPTLNCRIWIVFGNGDVITPYLTPSDGNTSSALLFDYQAELAPTKDFITCISDLID